MTDTLTPIRPATSCRSPDPAPALPIYLDKAVLDSMRRLVTEGFEVTCLAPRADGLLDPAAFVAALRPT